MKWHEKAIIYLLISILVGLILSAIPWGEPDSLHGRGIPFPIVIFDKPPGAEHFRDYVSLLSAPLNIAAVFLLIFLLDILVWAIRKFTKPTQ